MRTIDLCVSLSVLIFLTPIFLLLSIVLRATGEGEILYFQRRIGLDGKAFSVIKFATMLKDSPNLGTGTITSKNDVRILPVGRFLRKTKINELPQFCNILAGQMSLIGPRPHAEQDLLGVSDNFLKIIFNMKPGLSGIGSIVFRNEENILNNFTDPRSFYDTHIAPYKAELEVWYYYNRSIFLNIVLMLMTVYVVCSGKISIVYKVFKSLPRPSKHLEKYLIN